VKEKIDTLEFTQGVCGALQEALRGWVVDSPGVLQIRIEGGQEIRLDNLFLAVRSGQATLADAVAFLLRRLEDGPNAPREPSQDRLIPLIRNEEWLESTLASSGGLPNRKLVGPLRVVCAMDRGGSLQVVRRIDADKLRLRDEGLFARAVANLEARAQGMELVQISPGIYRLQLDKIVDSSLLLLRPLMEQLAQRLGGPLWACAPAAGLLLLGTQPQNLRAMGEVEFAGQHHALCPQVWAWSGDGWKAWGEGPEGREND
jgi:hypothetical protein